MRWGDRKREHAKLWKTAVPVEKPISLMQCKPYVINLDEGFTAIKAQENNNNNNKTKQKQRERERRTHTLTQLYIRIYVLMQYLKKWEGK